MDLLARKGLLDQLVLLDHRVLLGRRDLLVRWVRRVRVVREDSLVLKALLGLLDLLALLGRKAQQALLAKQEHQASLAEDYLKNNSVQFFSVFKRWKLGNKLLALAVEHQPRQSTPSHHLFHRAELLCRLVLLFSFLVLSKCGTMAFFQPLFPQALFFHKAQ